MMRAILTLAILAGLLVPAVPAKAFTYLDRAYGTPELGLSARSRGMGGAGVALGTGTYSLVDNPAGLILMPGTRVQLQGSLTRASEDRLVPLFDTFDSFVDETAIAVNDNGYGGAEGGFVLDRWGASGVLVSGGIFNRYDFRYDYSDEFRTSDTSDQLINNLYIETEGVLRAATLGVALPIGNGSGLGVAVNYYFGTVNDRNALVYRRAQDSGKTTVTQSERQLDGWSVTLGALAHVDERIDVGASIETSAQLHDDYTLWENGTKVTGTGGNGDLNLPYRLQGGVAYHPRNTFRTTFAADVVYQPWSELEDHLNPDQNLNDVWEARFGIEHVFYNNLPARIGFRYGESYAMDEAQQSAFTFGFGYLVNNMTLDLGGEVGKRTTRQDPLRDRSDQQGYSVGFGTDKVVDTTVRVFLGVDYAF